MKQNDDSDLPWNRVLAAWMSAGIVLATFMALAWLDAVGYLDGNRRWVRAVGSGLLGAFSAAMGLYSLYGRKSVLRLLVIVPGACIGIAGGCMLLGVLVLYWLFSGFNLKIQ